MLFTNQIAWFGRDAMLTAFCEKKRRVKAEAGVWTGISTKWMCEDRTDDVLEGETLQAFIDREIQRCDTHPQSKAQAVWNDGVWTFFGQAHK